MSHSILARIVSQRNVPLGLLLTFLAACSAPPPPSSIALDPRMTEWQVVATIDALEQWCDAVDWCPTIDANSSHRVVFQTHARYLKNGKEHYFRDGLEYTSVAYNNHGGNIYIDESAITEENWWTTIAHELGHYGITGHTPVGMMSPVPANVFSLDRVSADAWCDEQGC